MFSLKNRLAVVTGASGAIGGAIVEQMSKAGAKILASGRNEGKLKSLAAKLGNGCGYLAVDLADEGAVPALAAEAERMGGAAILVNNAGFTKDALLLRLKRRDMEEVMKVNFTVGFDLAKALLPRMLKARHGRIINITSVIGSVGNPGQVAYAASKAAVAGMSRSLAREVASRGITVNCIAPGFIATPMTEGLADDSLLKRIPAARLGEPKDVAAAAVFLAGDEAAYITGSTIHINGGMAMF